MFYKIKKDIEYIMENDPAARTKLEVFLLYPSIHARLAHMISHFLYKKNLLLINSSNSTIENTTKSIKELEEKIEKLREKKEDF